MPRCVDEFVNVLRNSLRPFYVKAFTFQKTVKAKKRVQYSADAEQKRLHVPLPDRQVSEPAPYIVAVQGPPKVSVILFASIRLLRRSVFAFYAATIDSRRILLTHLCCKHSYQRCRSANQLSFVH